MFSLLSTNAKLVARFFAGVPSGGGRRRKWQKVWGEALRQCLILEKIWVFFLRRCCILCKYAMTWYF